MPLYRHELRRRGSTWLGPDGRWGALDTQSYHALRFNRWRGCYFREYAMGWGTAQGQKIKAPEGLTYVEEPPFDFSEQDFWRWVELLARWDLLDDVTNPLANSYAMAAVQRWPGRGLPAYRDIALPRSSSPLRFAVAVGLAGSSLKTTNGDSAVRTPLGAFRYAALGQEDAVTVTSAAETYFARPERRADGRDELATLFRPYWQARLSAVSKKKNRRGRAGKAGAMNRIPASQQGQALVEALLMLPLLALLLWAASWIGGLQFTAREMAQASRKTAMAGAWDNPCGIRPYPAAWRSRAGPARYRVSRRHRSRPCRTNGSARI